MYPETLSIRNFKFFWIFGHIPPWKFNNLSKTGSFVEIFQREPSKIIKLVKKVVKNRRLWVIFSTKTRYSSLDSLDRGIQVGFKMKYNCCMIRIQVLKKIIWSWFEEIRVRTWNFKNFQKKNSFDKRDALKLSSCHEIKLKFILDYN